MLDIKNNRLFKKIDLEILGALYFAILLISFFLSNIDFDLNNEASFTIGQATLKGVDIGSRVSLFYKAAIVGFILFVVAFLILKKIKQKIGLIKYYQEFEFLFSFQILLMLFGSFSEGVWLSEKLLHGTIVLLFILESTKRKIEWKLAGTTIHSAFLAFIGLTVFIENIYLSVAIFLAILFVLSIERVKVIRNGMNVLLSGLPFLFVILLELAMVLNQRGLNAVTCLVILSIGIIGSCWFLLYKAKHLKDVIYQLQMPLLLGGVVLYATYAFQIEQFNELFEYGNKLNPIMMMHSYGAIPFLDFFSSHLLSDFFWESLYVLLNGYSSSVELVIYNSFGIAIGAVISYYFLISIFNRSIGLALTILLLPFYEFFLPLNFAFALLPIVFLVKFARNEKRKDLFFFAATSVLLVFWRVDLGVGTVFALMGVFATMFILEKDRRFFLLKIGGLFVAFFGIVFCIYYSVAASKIVEAINYFGGSQAHGLDVLYYQLNNWFYIDYFILPGAILLIGSLLILNSDKYKINIAFYPLIFLIGFYFMNFQRGLVRHSFTELNESFVSSFGWLIIIIFSFGFIYRTLSLKWIVVLFISGSLLSIHLMTNWTNMVDKTKSISVNNIPSLFNGKIDRVIKNDQFDQETWPVIKFLKNHTNKNQTFLDFSNSPMLYYYTNREVPSVFAQYLQNTVNEFLQDENLKLLRTKDIPYVVFRQNPESFFDHTDGISNKVRYFKITPFIYDNYQPFKQIGKFEVWKLKSKDIVANKSLMHGMDDWNLGLLPYFWKGVKGESRILNINQNQIIIDTVTSSSFLKLEIDAKKEGICSIQSNDLKIDFNIKLNKNTYYLPIGVSYNLVNNKIESINFKLEDARIVSASEIKNK